MTYYFKHAMAIVSVVFLLIFAVGLLYPTALEPLASLSSFFDWVFWHLDAIDYLLFGGVAIWSTIAWWHTKQSKISRYLILISFSGFLLCLLKILSENLLFDNRLIESIVLALRYFLSVAIFWCLIVVGRSRRSV